jgi:hypothetical protein
MSIKRFIDKRNESPMRHIEITPFESSIQYDVHSGIYNITRRATAQILDMHESAVVDAVIQCARENNVDDLYLLDKKFVLDALREKMERDRPVRTYMDNRDIDVSGLLKED